MRGDIIDNIIGSYYLGGGPYFGPCFNVEFY